MIVLWVIMLGDGKEKFKNILKLEFMATLFEYIINAVLSLFLHNNVKQDMIFIIISVILIFIMVILQWVKKRYLMNRDEGAGGIVSEKIIYICACIMGVSLFFTISGLEMEKEFVPYRGFSEFVGILTVVLLISILLLVLFLLYVNDMNRVIKDHLEMERFLKDSQKKYYETMLKQEEDTKRYRHDMMNHLICLQEIVKFQGVEAVTDYIESLQSEIIEIQHKRHRVGNLVIEAVLNYYTQTLEDSVEVSVFGKCPEEIDITQMELCTVFSNIMKNAVEGLERQKKGKKYLNINFNAKKEVIKIEIINSIEQKVGRIKENLPETIKKDKENHGFGMRNVKEIVKKNGGKFQWLQSGTEFRVIVFLPYQIE